MSSESSLQTSSQITCNEMDYLTKELGIQFEIEAKARDRAEKMVEYLLATLVAIVAATIILSQSIRLMPLIFAGIFLIFIFGVISFHRTCRLRNTITHTRIARFLIRRVLENGGVEHAFLFRRIEGDPTGFSSRININMIWFALLCGLVGFSLFTIGGGIILLQDINLVSVNGRVIFVIATFFGYFVYRILRRELGRYIQKSNKLLKENNIYIGECELPTIIRMLTIGV